MRRGNVPNAYYGFDAIKAGQSALVPERRTDGQRLDVGEIYLFNRAIMIGVDTDISGDR